MQEVNTPELFLAPEVPLTPEEKLKQLSEYKANNISSSVPIILIDNSGSTTSYIHGMTTLEYEVKLIQNKLTKLGCQQCHLMFWNSSHTLVNDPVNVTELYNTFKRLKINSHGGTDISVAIHYIPDLWYQKHTHIFIVTDGEVNEDKYKFTSQVFNLAKKYINLNIITVETNEYNYMKNIVNAGSNIFTVLQNNKLTKYVRLFECFNKFHKTEPFVNLCNPEIGKGEFSYREFVFSDEKFHDFVNIICEIINENRNNVDYLDKVMYFISFTIFSYVKNKSQKIKNEVINLFTSLFEEVFSDTKKLTNIFESEIISHVEGTGKTYQQYKENRKKLFERTLDDLKNNVMDCFATGKFMSFIINTKNPKVKKILESNITNSYVRLSDTYYNNGAIHYGNHYLPMLPLDIIDNENSTQALRQWMRAIYARIHQIQVNDERILYLFLTDMMSIILSNLPDCIKNSYKKCAKVMLDAKRFNSGDLKQIVFLTMGNKPKPMISGYFTMEEIFEQCKKHFCINANISIDELWYGICLAYGDANLIKSQLPHNYDKNELLEKLRQYNVDYLYENIVMEKDLEYIDYITFEDISETGGYKYPDYQYGKKIFKSSFLISHDTYEKLIDISTDGYTKCPITRSNVKLSSFIKIPPKKQNANNVAQDDSEFDMKIFNKQYFQKVNLIEADQMNLLNLPLKSVESYDFTNYPYEFYPPVPIITEKLYKEKEQYRTIHDYQNQLKLRFDWLKDINMTDLVIAGGFNKSIILDEKVNDIDIYMYGSSDDNKYFDTLSRLINDITTALCKKYTNITYLAAYKKEFNVYELIYFENVKNLQKDKFELQDLIQMKFITKIQIIMKKHLEAKDIFNIYDIDACCVLYDGKQLCFTDRSYFAYRYLITIPRIDNHYTDVFDMRLLKYYKSGFRIALPRLTIDQIKDRLDADNNFVLNKCKFHVQEIQNHNVFVDKCELLVEKVENEVKDDNNIDKLNQTGVSVYNSVIGDIGSLNDSRSIVSFMKYIKRQNKLVERVKNKLNKGETVNEENLLSEINKEMNEEIKQKLKDLKLRGKRYVKHEVILSDNDDDLDSEDENVNKNIVVDNKNDAHKTNSSDANSNTINVHIEESQNNNNELQLLKTPEEYIRVYYKVSTLNDTRTINEFDNGTSQLTFIWIYENYHKQKDWYNCNVEKQNKIIEDKEQLAKEAKEKEKLEKEQQYNKSNVANTVK